MTTTNQTETPDVAPGGRQPLCGRWRKVRPAATLAGALLGVTVMATACSSGHPATAGLSLSQGDQEMVSFTHCMRAHGVQLSDPYHRPGHTGLTLDLPTPVGATRTAYAACTHFIAPLMRAKDAGAAALAAPRLAALTRYAQCMRAHDITMLDPNAEGELALGNVPGMASNDFGRQSPQFRSADAACRHLLPPGVTDNGTGP